MPTFFHQKPTTFNLNLTLIELNRFFNKLMRTLEQHPYKESLKKTMNAKKKAYVEELETCKQPAEKARLLSSAFLFVQTVEKALQRTQGLDEMMYNYHHSSAYRPISAENKAYSYGHHDKKCNRLLKASGIAFIASLIALHCSFLFASIGLAVSLPFFLTTFYYHTAVLIPNEKKVQQEEHCFFKKILSSPLKNSSVEREPDIKQENIPLQHALAS